jgi:hypothetical protein
MRHRLYQIASACAALLFSGQALAQPQIGDHWSRVPVTPEIVQQGDSVFNSLFKSTVRVNDATGVFLGIYAGVPVLMTAHHVMPDQENCTGRDVVFYSSAQAKSALIETHFTCARLLGAWADVDVSLFALDAKQSSNPTLQGRGLKPGFDARISQFAMLYTMGHGSEQNPSNTLTADWGSDCYVANATDDFRFRENTTWSMALGCNESAGDSGSPVVDRVTGLLFGIVWGGHTEKDPALANSAYFKSLVQSNSPDIWVQLNYASPMPVVGAMFKYILKTQQLDPQTVAVLNALLN